MKKKSYNRSIHITNSMERNGNRRRFRNYSNAFFHEQRQCFADDKSYLISLSPSVYTGVCVQFMSHRLLVSRLGRFKIQKNIFQTKSSDDPIETYDLRHYSLR